MKKPLIAAFVLTLLGCTKGKAFPVAANPEIVHFPSAGRELGGELYKPTSNGPFPAILYNHGSAPGMLNSQASKVLGPLFASKGWVFFMPYRRGQGLSSAAGPYIGDEIESARGQGGFSEGAAVMTKLLSTDHLQDQLAGLWWLRSQSFVQRARIAVAGNSFGGIESVLGAAQESYCAAVDAAGAAETWEKAPDLQQLLKKAARAAKAPMFFFQAENDFDVSPSKVLYAEMKQAGKEAEIKIYPPFGRSPKDGHSFAYLGSATWFPDVLNFVQKHCGGSVR